MAFGVKIFQSQITDCYTKILNQLYKPPKTINFLPISSLLGSAGAPASGYNAAIFNVALCKLADRATEIVAYKASYHGGGGECGAW